MTVVSFVYDYFIKGGEGRGGADFSCALSFFVGAGQWGGFLFWRCEPFAGLTLDGRYCQGTLAKVPYIRSRRGPWLQDGFPRGQPDIPYLITIVRRYLRVTGYYYWSDEMSKFARTRYVVESEMRCRVM